MTSPAQVFRDLVSCLRLSLRQKNIDEGIITYWNYLIMNYTKVVDKHET